MNEALLYTAAGTADPVAHADDGRVENNLMRVVKITAMIASAAAAAAAAADVSPRRIHDFTVTRTDLLIENKNSRVNVI